MAILNNPEDFVSGENITAAKLNNLVNGATFLSGAGQATDDSTLEVNDGVGGDGSLRVKDLGITSAKLADNAVTASKIAPSAATAIMPIGGVLPYAGATSPIGWLLCSGQTIGDVGSGADFASADYETLFNLIKSYYGNAGTEVWADGDTVLLPDLQGRVIAGMGGNTMPDAKAYVNGAVTSSTNLAVDGNYGGSIVVGMTVTGTGIGSGVTVTTVTDQNNLVLSSAITVSDNVFLTFTIDDSLGERGGAKEHTLTIDEMPGHQHKTDGTDGSDRHPVRIGADSHIDATSQTADSDDANYQLGSETGTAGGGQAHNNVQPTIILNYIIKY